MKNIDPYEILDVPRDADTPAVVKAYRRAAKTAHPDARGSEDAFRRVAFAYRLLIDRRRRRIFDQTGKLEEDEVDNTAAGALALFELFIEGRIAAYLNQDFDPKLDPRRNDLVAEFCADMRRQIDACEVAITMSAKTVRFLEDMKKRFTGNRSVLRAFEMRLARVEDQRREMKMALDQRNAALSLASKIKFKFDQPSQRTTTTASTAWFGTTSPA